MTRIDHAQLARQHICWTHRWQEVVGSTDESEFANALIANALIAQAHATLALVEQQRIANLIALGQLAGREDVHEQLSDAAHGALFEVIGTVILDADTEHVVLAPEIAAALGIEAGESGE